MKMCNYLEEYLINNVSGYNIHKFYVGTNSKKSTDKKFYKLQQSKRLNTKFCYFFQKRNFKKYKKFKK